MNPDDADLHLSTPPVRVRSDNLQKQTATSGEVAVCGPARTKTTEEGVRLNACKRCPGLAVT
jgi:hypothetical protein